MFFIFFHFSSFFIIFHLFHLLNACLTYTIHVLLCAMFVPCSNHDPPRCYDSFHRLNSTIASVQSLVHGRMDIIGIPPSAAGEIEILTEEVQERQFCHDIELELYQGRIFGAAGALNLTGARKVGLRTILASAHAMVASPRGTAMQSLA